MSVPRRKREPLVFDTDESVRPDSSLEALPKTKAGLQIRRNGHRRQRAENERRGGSSAGCFRKPSPALGSEPYGAHRGPGDIGPRAGVGHDDPGAGGPRSY